jgi:hypothetical protein
MQNLCSSLCHCGEVSGGMSRRSGMPLGERPRRDAAARAAGARHCWVNDERYPDKLPGLLLRWEQGARGWRGLVVYAVPEPEGLVQRWLDDADLSPC